MPAALDQPVRSLRTHPGQCSIAECHFGCNVLMTMPRAMLKAFDRALSSVKPFVSCFRSFVPTVWQVENWPRPLSGRSEYSVCCFKAINDHQPSRQVDGAFCLRQMRRTLSSFHSPETFCVIQKKKHVLRITVSIARNFLTVKHCDSSCSSLVSACSFKSLYKQGTISLSLLRCRKTRQIFV